MTYWIIIWLAICPITGQEIRNETRTYNKPLWKESNIIELPNHLAVFAYPEKITEFWEEYKPSKDGISVVVIKKNKEWEKP